MVVAIGREAGTGGREVARMLARRLGYRLLDRQVIAALARETGVSYRTAAQRDETVEHWFERIKAPLDFIPPETAPAVPSKSTAEITEKLVRKYAEDDNVVILGRASAAILRNRPDVFRVFLYAPLEWRAKQFAGKRKVTLASAREQVEQIDRQRRDYLDTYYRVNWRDPSLYDFCFNMERVGPEGAVDLIESTLRGLLGREKRAA